MARHYTFVIQHWFLTKETFVVIGLVDNVQHIVKIFVLVFDVIMFFHCPIRICFFLAYGTQKGAKITDAVGCVLV